MDKAQTLALAAELRVAIGNLKRHFRDQAKLGGPGKLAPAEQEELAHAVKLLKRLVQGETSWQ